MTKLRGVPLWRERGQLISLDGDVLGIVQQVKQISDRLDVCYNEFLEFDGRKGGFTITEHCLDGTERLVFSVEELDQRVVMRLMAADHWRGRDTPEHVLGDEEDFVNQVDAENARIQADLDEAGMDQILDAGERFAHAMQFDGKGVGAQILVPTTYSKKVADG